MQHVYKVSEPTSRELSARLKHVYTVSKPVCRECRSEVRLFFTVSEPSSWGYALFIGFWNLPQGTCSLVVQPVYKVSEPTYMGLSDRGEAY